MGTRGQSIRAVALALLLQPALAAEPRTEHTFALAEGEARPAATLEDASMLVGNWDGEAFGSRIEEVWNPPSADSMLGMFKLFDEDGVAFYELMLIVVEGGTLSLKARHFNADFTAWEDKDEDVTFRLVALEDGALHFGGLSFYRRGPDHLDAYLVMRGKNGIRGEPLSYRRRPPP